MQFVNIYLCLYSDFILLAERALYLLLALATKYLATSGHIMYQVHHHHHHRHRHRHGHGYGFIINTIIIINIVAFTTTTTTTIIIIVIIILIIISFDKAGYITCRR